jgi:hypothetical protein
VPPPDALSAELSLVRLAVAERAELDVEGAAGAVALCARALAVLRAARLRVSGEARRGWGEGVLLGDA